MLVQPCQLIGTNYMDIQRPGELEFRCIEFSETCEHAARTQTTDAAAVLAGLEECVVGLGAASPIHAGGLAFNDEEPVAGHERNVQFVAHAVAVFHDEVGRFVSNVESGLHGVERLKHVMLQPAALAEESRIFVGKSQPVGFQGQHVRVLEVTDQGFE